MVVVEVCVGSSCHIKGSAFVIGVLQDKIRAHKLDQQVELKACFCMGECRWLNRQSDPLLIWP